MVIKWIWTIRYSYFYSDASVAGILKSVEEENHNFQIIKLQDRKNHSIPAKGCLKLASLSTMMRSL